MNTFTAIECKFCFFITPLCTKQFFDPNIKAVNNKELFKHLYSVLTPLTTDLSFFNKYKYSNEIMLTAKNLANHTLYTPPTCYKQNKFIIKILLPHISKNLNFKNNFPLLWYWFYTMLVTRNSKLSWDCPLNQNNIVNFNALISLLSLCLYYRINVRTDI